MEPTEQSRTMPKTPCQTSRNTAGRHLRAVAYPVLLAAALSGGLCNGAVAAQEVVLSLPRLPPVIAPRIDTAVSRQVDLFVDFAVILQIAGDVSVIVLGNSEIADASVVAAGTVALTGKAAGTTNIMVLSPDGSVLSELRVQVTAHKPGTVTVRRALLPSIYACSASSCRRTDADNQTAQ